MPGEHLQGLPPALIAGGLEFVGHGILGKTVLNQGQLAAGCGWFQLERCHEIGLKWQRPQPRKISVVVQRELPTGSPDSHVGGRHVVGLILVIPPGCRPRTSSSWNDNGLPSRPPLPNVTGRDEQLKAVVTRCGQPNPALINARHGRVSFSATSASRAMAVGGPHLNAASSDPFVILRYQVSVCMTSAHSLSTVR